MRFKVKGEESLYFLAWTTTPWTLPSNMALCAGSDLVYCIVREKESGDCYILTQSCVESYFENESHEIMNKMKGSELLGMKYEPLFDFAKKKVGLRS